MAEELNKVPFSQIVLRKLIVSESFTPVDENKVMCKYCLKFYSTKTSPTILKRHLVNRHHDIINEDVLETKQKPSQEGFISSLICWMIDDLQPFSVVERKSFQNLIESIPLNVTIPCRQSIAKLMDEEFEKERTIQISQLSTLKSKISLTLDIWTSNSDDPYIGVIAHFVNSNWKLESKVLSVCKFEHPHTGEAIGEKLISISNQYSIANKIVSITTDSAANMIRGYETFANYLYETYQIRLIHYRCAAHIINLVVQKSKLKSNPTIERARNVIKHILSSSKLIQDLRTTQTDRAKPLELILDCPTRWNSTFDMLERMITLKSSLLKLSIDHPDIQNLLPTIIEWDEIELLCEFLKPFNTATKILSANKICSIGYTLFVFKALQISLDENKSRVQNSALMLEVLNRYISRYSPDMLICAFLDPQNKGRYFEQIPESLMLNINEVYNQYKLLFGNLTIQQEEKNCNELDDSLLTLIVNRKRKRTELQTSEIERYLEIQSPRGEFDIMKWWENNTQQFPVLSAIAADYLSCQATSVECERLFSIAGLTSNKTRNRLDPQTVNILLCLKNWKSQNP